MGLAMIAFTKDEIHCKCSVNQTVYAADKLAATAREINHLAPAAEQSSRFGTLSTGGERRRFRGLGVALQE